MSSLFSFSRLLLTLLKRDSFTNAVIGCHIFVNQIKHVFSDPENKTQDKLITNNSHNGEADQNSNVVQKIEDDVQDKEKQLRLQVSATSFMVSDPRGLL